MITITTKSNEYMKNGSPVFVYTLGCNEAEKADYKAKQGDFYREDEKGNPLFFSSRVLQIGAEVRWAEKTQRYSAITDLEAIAARTEAIKAEKLASLEALAEFTGLTKAQLAERMLEKLV